MGKSHSHVLVGGKFPSPIFSEKAIPMGMGWESHPIPVMAQRLSERHQQTMPPEQTKKST